MTTRVRRLTPPGPGGVALVAVDGPGAAALLEAAFVRRGGAPGLPAPGRTAVGRLLDPAGEPVDEVVLARAGADGFELGCHGGPAVVDAALAALRARGAVDGPAGAWPVADDDRVGAEALLLLPFAATELGCRALLGLLAGGLRREVEAALAALDRDDRAAARTRLARLGASARLGRALLAPPHGAAPRVALVGPPNAGKSSLLNALAGRDRAIVSPEPGTTRDAVEEPVELDGVPAVLVDTAGQRDAADGVERAGVARARAEAASADLRLAVVDAADDDDRGAALARAAAAPRLVVLTKVDLLDPAGRAAVRARLGAGEALEVSSSTGEGLPALVAALRGALVGPAPPDDAPLLVTPRQVGLVEGALRAVDAGRLDKARLCLRGLVG